MASQNRDHTSQFPLPIGEAEWLSSGHFTLSTRAMVKFRVRSLNGGKCHLLLLSLSIAIQPWQEGPCPGPWSTPLHGVRNYRQRGRAHLEPEPFFTGHALGGQTSELPVQMATKPAQVSSPGSACKGGLCCLCAHLGPLEQPGLLMWVCGWDLDVQAGVRSMCAGSGKEAGVGRGRRWAAGQFSPHLDVL